MFLKRKNTETLLFNIFNEKLKLKTNKSGNLEHLSKFWNLGIPFKCLRGSNLRNFCTTSFRNICVFSCASDFAFNSIQPAKFPVLIFTHKKRK